MEHMGLVDSLNDAFNKGVSGTERLLEVGKLKTRISTLGKARSELLMSLGTVAYEQFRIAEGDVSAFSELGERIRAVEVDIAQAEARIEELESGSDAHTRPCSECAHENPLPARFCVKCGTELRDAPSKMHCASCGTELPEGSKFCIRCGTPAGSRPDDSDQSASEEKGQS